jgi:CheY-like chemotaxis protein
LTTPVKILGVDDEADFEALIRQRFRRQIRDNEFAFRFAHHGEEALEVLAASGRSCTERRSGYLRGAALAA